MPYDYGPYKRLKEQTTRQVTGMNAAGARAEGNLLGESGTGDIPGVRSSVLNRRNYQMSNQISESNARVDLAYTRDKAGYDKWKTEFDFKVKALKDAKSEQEKQQFWSIIGSLIGVAGGVGAAYMTSMALAGAAGAGAAALK